MYKTERLVVSIYILFFFLATPIFDNQFLKPQRIWFTYVLYIRLPYITLWVNERQYLYVCEQQLGTLEYYKFSDQLQCDLLTRFHTYLMLLDIFHHNLVHGICINFLILRWTFRQSNRVEFATTPSFRLHRKHMCTKFDVCDHTHLW